jgi:hypothetical protein
MDGSWCIHEESFASLWQLLEHKAGKSSHFVLQERIRQHPWFAAWNQSSLNTIRMMTYRSVVDNAVHPLGAVVRFGRPGSLVDNQAAGGLTCGVLKNGKTGSFVCDKMGRFKGEDSAWLSVMQSEVPMFKKMVSKTIHCSTKLSPWQPKKIGMPAKKLNTVFSSRILWLIVFICSIHPTQNMLERAE